MSAKELLEWYEYFYPKKHEEKPLEEQIRDTMKGLTKWHS